MTDPSRASTSLCRCLTNQLNINDLELIMHWHNSTYRSVSRDSTVEGIWQKAVPQEAVQHPFLMHGLLALSSLDRACGSGGRVREERVRIAQQHQNRAIGGLSAVRRLEDNRSLSTCNAMFALACVMIYYDLALPLLTDPAEGRSALDEFCRVLERVCESIVVMAEVIDRVRGGELCPLIREDGVRPKMPDTSRLAIQSLRRRNRILATRDKTHETDTYETTIQHLSTALERLAEGGELTVIAIRWIWFIPTRFIELVRIREPFALVILAHFAVIMHSLRRHWWMGEWGNRVLQDIGQTLDAEWRQSIDWVIDATGCYISIYE